VQKTATFFMFTGAQFGNAEAAMRLYTSLFDHSKIVQIEYWKPGEPGGAEGHVKRGVFELEGVTYMASENAMEHSFSFTPSISLFVQCSSQEEIERLGSDPKKWTPRKGIL
jgi:predicted 3-demethylubiquinone-9 3-methyltransferase (glyoxalase superfamily)